MAITNETAIGRLEFLESVIQRGLGTFVEVGNALRDIRDNRLYEPKYGQVSFETYCKDRWGFSKQYAGNVMAAADVVGIANMETTVSVLPTENALRPLRPLRKDPEKLRQVWQSVTDAHPNEKITAPMVAEAVREHRAAEVPPATDTLIDHVEVNAVKPLGKLALLRIDKILYGVANSMRAVELHLPAESSLPAKRKQFFRAYVSSDHGFTPEELSRYIHWLKDLRAFLLETKC